MAPVLRSTLTSEGEHGLDRKRWTLPEKGQRQ